MPIRFRTKEHPNKTVSVTLLLDDDFSVDIAYSTLVSMRNSCWDVHTDRRQPAKQVSASIVRQEEHGQHSVTVRGEESAVTVLLARLCADRPFLSALQSRSFDASEWTIANLLSALLRHGTAKPALNFTHTPTKNSDELTAGDVPRGLSPDDVAKDAPDF